MKKIISLILAITLIFSVVPTAFALDATNYSGAKQIAVGSDIQASNTPFTDTWYKFTADEDQYYKVSILNQSVELRTNIYFDSWLDSSLFAGFFNGKLQVAIRDAYGLELAEGSVRCGYEGSVYLLLNKGQTYYIGFNSNYSGNFRFRVEKLNDIGGNTQNEATQITATAQVITMVDAKNDEDWFTFTTDSDHSFYHFSIENLNCSQYLYFDLYEYVEGAGLRDVYDTYASRSNTRQFNTELKDNTKYYYCVTSSSVGGYVINVEQVYDEVSADKDNAYEIERDVKITSSFDGDDDVDHYRFTTADEDAYYYITFDDLSGNGYYFDVCLIDNAKSKLMNLNNCYSGNGISKSIKLEKNTEYYVSFCGDELANYEFTVTTCPDPAPDVKENAMRIDRDKIYRADFAGVNDTDFYRFTTGSENAYYCIYFKDLSGNGYYYDLVLEDNSGNDLLYFNNLYSGSVINKGVKLENNTEYYVSFCGDKPANYEFEVNTKLDPEGDVKSEAKTISLNTEIKAELATASDVDWYKFTVSDYENCRVRLLNESGGTKRVYLYSERDMSLLNFSVSSGSYSKTKELEEGTYYLKVSDAEGYYSIAVGTCGNEHSWTLKRVIKPASCKEKGKESYYCSCCFETETRDVPKLTTHSYEWVTVSEPTATADGKKRQVCTVCSAYGETQIIARSKMGDADFDGTVSASDARYTLRASVGLEKCENGSKVFAIVDADRDNVISASDARLILRASVGLEKLS